jgi:hypothetical protein
VNDINASDYIFFRLLISDGHHRWDTRLLEEAFAMRSDEGFALLKCICTLSEMIMAGLHYCAYQSLRIPVTYSRKYVIMCAWSCECGVWTDARMNQHETFLWICFCQRGSRNTWSDERVYGLGICVLSQVIPARSAYSFDIAFVRALRVALGSALGMARHKRILLRTKPFAEQDVCRISPL